MVERRTHKPKVKGSIPFLATTTGGFLLARMKNRLPFPILYEDRDVIVVDKPAGLLTTQTRAKEPCTVEAWLNDYVRKGQRRSRLHVWLVHRLDRETSGVIMFAKTEEVAEWFRSDWDNLTEKIYIARVEGVLSDESGVFESYLRDDERTMKVRSVSDPRLGKLARTEWRRISADAGTTLVEVSLKSGRKNQIRVHFSEAGHPVVGDVKYGARPAARMCLRAVRLRFRHPHTGRWVEVAARPDASWCAVAGGLRAPGCGDVVECDTARRCS